VTVQTVTFWHTRSVAVVGAWISNVTPSWHGVGFTVQSEPVSTGQDVLRPEQTSARSQPEPVAARHTPFNTGVTSQAPVWLLHSPNPHTVFDELQLTAVPTHTPAALQRSVVVQLLLSEQTVFTALLTKAHRPPAHKDETHGLLVAGQSASTTHWQMLFCPTQAPLIQTSL
jgi:hypothetical protein